MDRQRFLRNADNGHFDVIIIGGGITGTGTAWDCALQGLRVLLLERSDFGGGTSGMSSKMVHAGFRYMKNDPELVEEASVERGYIFRACAHLAKPVEYLVPVYQNTPEYNADVLPSMLQKYDELAYFKNTHNHRMYTSRDAPGIMPELWSGKSVPISAGSLGKLLMVGSYWDGCMDDARITLETMHSASLAGATVLNYAEVIGFQFDKSGAIRGVRFRDKSPQGENREYSAYADELVCAGGPYTDLVLGLDKRTAEGNRNLIRPSKGVHLVFKKPVTRGKAVVVPMGGNILTFLVPLMLEDYMVMGTTDTDYPVQDYDDLDCIPVTGEDVRYNLDILDTLFPGIFSKLDLLACYSGVRPLANPAQGSITGISESDTSRTHSIKRIECGLWVIFGGKFTTFRLMAEQLTDRILKSLGEKDKKPGIRLCSTMDKNVHGCPASHDFPGEREIWLEESVRNLKKRMNLPESVLRHLLESYGSCAGEVLSLVESDSGLNQRIALDRPWIMAEIKYAVEQEMCLTVSDFLIRRTQLRFVENQGMDATENVADELGKLLGWSNELKTEQIDTYVQHIEKVWRRNI